MRSMHERFNVISDVKVGRWAAACVVALAAVSGVASVQAQALSAAQEAALRKALVGRLVNDGAAIKGIRPSPVKGLYEIELPGAVLYTDVKGDYLIEGQITDLDNHRNLTQERLDEINRVDFASLPFKDAVVWKNGTGQRKLVIFSDPHCGYCKKLEAELQTIKDLTVYTFIIPILSEDSKTLGERIWCARDRTQAYRDWMLSNTQPPRLLGMCVSPLQRNLQMSQKFGITGTPAMIFEDGTRLASAAAAAEVEKRLRKAAGR
jgi:thiol:disulfide interchange protein DsbC